MRPNVGTLLSLVFIFGSARLRKKMMVMELDEGRDAVLRVRGDVEFGCMYERGDLEGETITSPSCCYSGDHNNKTVCEKDVYPGDGGECRNMDTRRMVKVGDAFTGECILILWNVTKKDEGTYLAVFPGQRADNQPMQIKIKKDIRALLEGYHKSVIDSSLSRCQKQVESTISLLEAEKTENLKFLESKRTKNLKLLETEKTEKWILLGVGLGVGFFLSIFAIIINQIISLCCQSKSEQRCLPEEDEAMRGEATELTTNDRYECVDRDRSRVTSQTVPKWSSAYAIHKVATAIVDFFGPAALARQDA